MESEGPPSEQDQKDAYLQLIQGVQEWQDGCVYQGQFGLDMKSGYGEFSWPTGEVTGFCCFLPSSPPGLRQQGQPLSCSEGCLVNSEIHQQEGCQANVCPT